MAIGALPDDEKESVKDIDESQISSFASDKLCGIIATNRYLKFDKKMEILAMQELSKRREAGDAFDFEKEIDKCGIEFTPISASIPDAIDAAIKFAKSKV